MIPTLQQNQLHPFSEMDIAHLVSSRAVSRAEHPFLIWEPFEGQSKTWTYRDFDRDLRKIASSLKAKGVKQGDRVLVHLENCPESILSWYACAYIGAVAVMTNSNSVASELDYFMSFSEVVGAITQPKFADLVKASSHAIPWMVVTETDVGAAPESDLHLKDTEPFSALLSGEIEFSLRDPDPLLDAAIQFTSGTTSRPKGVVWTHANALWGGKISSYCENLRPEDVHLVYMPLFHTNATSYSVLATLWTGATMVLQPRYSASRFWDVSLKHKCTWTSMGPFMLNTLKKLPVPKHSYRCWGLPFVSAEAEKQFGVTIVGWWGMTETVTLGIVSDPFDQTASFAIGRASPVYDVAILNEDETPVAYGETGNLKIKGIPGISLFKEYLKNPEATEASYDKDGWFITGDRVTLLENGDIAFADRDKDVLKVGGENVSAFEIESVIMTVPGVIECAVVAKPDELRDEVPVAFVLTEEDQSDTFLKEIESKCCEELSEFKRPRAFFLVKELPRATLGKVAKAELRKRLIK